MKKKLLCIVIAVGTWGLQCLYEVFKLFGVKNRACFFSRQSDTLTIDFQLIQQQLRELAPEMEQVTICHRYRDGRDGAVRFAIDQLHSMWLMATSKACVLDAYWPVVSLLRHREELTVVQIWHSVGKIKRSGYQTLGMASGRDATLARALRMHRNYDYIISGGDAWTPYYCEAFDVTADKLRGYGLPRLDWLLEQEDTRPALEEKYPELRGKVLVLYAPTYRTYSISQHRELTELFAGAEDHVLISRFHPNQKFDDASLAGDGRYNSEDIFLWMRACDYLITDYSSLALEAAALEKKTVYYLFDYEQYTQQNGLNTDPKDMMPGCAFESAQEVFDAICHREYPMEELQRYRSDFLPACLGSSARKIAGLVAGLREEENAVVTV